MTPGRDAMSDDNMIKTDSPAAMLDEIMRLHRIATESLEKYETLASWMEDDLDVRGERENIKRLRKELEGTV